MKTWATAGPSWMGEVTVRSKNGAWSRCASGRAIQSWAPCVILTGEISLCAMPCPAVMRLSSRGRTGACEPTLSRCSISPSNSQLTVWSPVCGCGGTTIAVSSGP